MDSRVEQIYLEHMKNDTSFNNDSLSFGDLLFGGTYSNSDMRKTWELGIKHGIEIGLNVASIEGQIIELNNNTLSKKNKEFLEKFYKLTNEYKCAIQYHPIKGMVIVDTKK
jgi:hypothetical protein